MCMQSKTYYNQGMHGQNSRAYSMTQADTEHIDCIPEVAEKCLVHNAICDPRPQHLLGQAEQAVSMCDKWPDLAHREHSIGSP